MREVLPLKLAYRLLHHVAGGAFLSPSDTLQAKALP